MKKKRKSILPPDFWEQNAKHMRDLQERIAVLDRKIAAKNAAEAGGDQQPQA